MATRKLKITHVAYIGGLHYILVGQLRLPLGRAGRKPLGSRAPGTASRCFTERETQAGEGTASLKSHSCVEATAPQLETLASSGPGEMVRARLAPSLFWLWGRTDPGSYSKCVFEPLLNEVCGIW